MAFKKAAPTSALRREEWRTERASNGTNWSASCAKTADRTELGKMLDYCTTKKNHVAPLA